MIAFYMPLITCLIAFMIYQQRNGWVFGPISLLYFTYIGMCVAAVIGLIFKFELPVLPLSSSAMLYFSISLVLLFTGFYFFQDCDFKVIIIENEKFYNVIKYFLLISSILSIIYFLPFALNSLDGDISANRDNQINLAQMSRFGIINTFFSLVGNCFIFCQIAGLVELNSSTKKSAILGYTLIISSLSYYVYILAYVGRDGFVYWTMSAIFSYFLVRHFLPKHKHIKVIILFIILEVIILIPFLQITNSRFGSGIYSELQINEPRKEIHVLSELLPDDIKNQAKANDSRILYILENFVDYAGQQIANFNDLFVVAPPLRRGGGNFPKILQLLEKIGINLHPIYERSEIDEYYFAKGTVPWEFSTLIGSFFTDFGKFGTMIFMIVMSLLSLVLLKNARKKQGFFLSELLLFVLLYQSAYWGVFYYRLSSANLYILVVLFISIILYMTKSKNSFKVIFQISR